MTEKSTQKESYWGWYDLDKKGLIPCVIIFKTKKDSDAYLRTMREWHKQLKKRFVSVKINKTILSTYEYEKPNKNIQTAL